MVSVGKVQAVVALARNEEGPVLQDMIERAVAFIQTQTRRYFGPITEVTEYVSGTGSRNLWLSEPAILTDGEVVLVEERPYPGGSATEITVAGYQARLAERSSYLVRLGGSVWTRDLEYAVTYERGYDVDAGPPDIAQLVIDLIALKLKFKNKEGMRSETIGGYSYTRFGEGDLDSIDGAKSTIAAWRRPVLAP